MDAHTSENPPPVTGGAAVPPPTGRPTPATSRRWYLLLAAAVVVGLGAVGVFALLAVGRQHTDDAQVQADVVLMSFQVGGTIRKVNVIENQAVRKGDPLLELDDADFRVRRAQAEADLATARAQVSSAESQERVITAGARGGLHSAQASLSSAASGVQSAIAQVEAARASLARAEADARKADADFGRMNALRADGAVAQKDLDDAQAARDAAQAAVAQARAGLTAAEEARHAAESYVAEQQGKLDASAPIDAQIATAAAQVELARARVQAAEAALELARLQLSYASLAAPDDGMVSSLSAFAGQQVSPGQPVANFVPRETYVLANFKETQIGRMRPGNPVEIRIDAFPGRTFQGVVESISGGTGARFALLPPDNASGNFVKVVQRVPVRINWKTTPDVPLRAGLSVFATVDVRKGSPGMRGVTGGR